MLTATLLGIPLTSNTRGYDNGYTKHVTSSTAGIGTIDTIERHDRRVQCVGLDGTQEGQERVGPSDPAQQRQVWHRQRQ